jgi:protein ImuA
MLDSIRIIDQLRRHLEQLEQHRFAPRAGLFPLGHDAIDARLGGGLARGALHEICFGPETSTGNSAAASSFALMLAARSTGDAAILWIREDKGERLSGQLYGPGMVELGIDPARVVLVKAPDTIAALRVGSDVLGCMAPGAVVIEPFGAAKALDLTASRRLALAAAKSSVAAFILRSAEGMMASAAATRWRVTAAPSTRLPGNAPGQTMLALELIRHRGGVAPFETVVEWNRDEQIFRDVDARNKTLPRDLPADAERGQMAA